MLAAGRRRPAGGLMTAHSANRDIVVIGASAGGTPALQRLLAALPRDLPAALFVVLHIGREQTRLAEVLNCAGPLPAVEAESGTAFEAGHVYVAAPDRHMLVHDGHILLRRGPHENLARPAIDPLFRSAACTFGPRVIGIVLSGALNDGAAGLRAVKQCGGLALVQDPGDAAVSAMPLSAQCYVAVDHVVPAATMGPLLARLVAGRAGPMPAIPRQICVEAAIAAQELGDMASQQQWGELCPVTCPECGGALWQVADGDLLRYRCHVGHAYTADAMLAAQSDETERLLSRLLRFHRERAALTRRMASQERAHQRRGLADELDARARGYEEDAAIIEGLLSRGDGASA
jgi:two-component system, chemotaxis family, protein-glutamate methylesterase/glutaminase